MSDADGGRRRLVSLKVLYTLHGVASQKFVVKPGDQVEARVFESSDLGIVSLQSCLDAIRRSSPDYAEICDSSAKDYAIYSVDYAEEGLPLQGHGRVSEHVLREVTGVLRPSSFAREQLELQIHLLPIRIPPDANYDGAPDSRDIDIHQVRDFLSSQMPHNMTLNDNREVLQTREGAAGPAHDPSPRSSDFFNYGVPGSTVQYGMPFPPMPAITPMPSMPPLPLLPAMPASLQSSATSDSFLPSSPPVRAKPQRISGPGAQAGSGAGPGSSAAAAAAVAAAASSRGSATSDITPAKRSPPDSTSSGSSGSKKKKQASPSSSCVEASCGNCGVATASTWRRAHLETGDVLLCNACGLYYKTKNAMRPSFLWDRSSRLANRVPEPSIAKPPPTKTIKRPSQLGSDPSGPSAGSETGSQASASQPDSDNHSAPSREATDASSPETEVHNAKPPKRRRTSRSKRPKTEQPEEIDEPQHPLQVHLPELPSTPRHRTTSPSDESQPVPSSIEKLFFVTPDGKKTVNIHLPGSGSAGKWLNRMLNPAEESSYFESFLASPTPKKTETNFRLGDSPICSSPPTSSNLFSEIPDWNVFPTSPTPLKAALLPAPPHHDQRSGERHRPTHKNSAAEVI